MQRNYLDGYVWKVAYLGFKEEIYFLKTQVLSRKKFT